MFLSGVCERYGRSGKLLVKECVNINLEVNNAKIEHVLASLSIQSLYGGMEVHRSLRGIIFTIQIIQP